MRFLVPEKKTVQLKTALCEVYIYVQRVPALRTFWDLEKTVSDEIRVSGTVLWSPTNPNSPTYTYINKKPW